MLKWLFSREKAAYEKGCKRGYKEGYAAHESESLATYECPNPHCTKFRSEWRNARSIGYEAACKDLENSLTGAHSSLEGPRYGYPCECEICTIIGKYATDVTIL